MPASSTAADCPGPRSRVPPQRPRPRRRAAVPPESPARRRGRRVHLLGARRRRPGRGPHRPHRRGRRAARHRRGPCPRGRRPPRWRTRRRGRAVGRRARRRHRHPLEVLRPPRAARCSRRRTSGSTSSTRHDPSSTTRASLRQPPVPPSQPSACSRDHPELLGASTPPPRASPRPVGFRRRQARSCRYGWRGPHEAVEAVERARAHGIRIGCLSGHRRRPTGPRGCGSRHTPTSVGTISTGPARCSPRSSRRAADPWLTRAR